MTGPYGLEDLQGSTSKSRTIPEQGVFVWF